MRKKNSTISLRRKKKNAFNKARKALSEAKYKNDIRLLYGIFVALFIDYFGESISQSSFFDIENYVLTRSITQDLVSSWVIFFSCAQEITFGKSDKKIKDEKDLFRQAEQWINRFEKNFLK